jgi:hypothetical protein
MTLHRPTFFVLMILLLPVSSMSADAPLIPAVVGCYELSSMTWEPDPKGDIVYLIAPKKIWLTRTRAFAEGTQLLLPAPGQPQTFHNNTYWETDPNGEIRLYWKAGLAQSGLLMILKLSEAGKLTGVAKVSFDIPTPYKDVPVVATKVSCGKAADD